METADLASTLLSMNAARTQLSVNTAVLKKQIEMQKSVLDILDPQTRATPAPGTGKIVDKTA